MICRISGAVYMVIIIDGYNVLKQAMPGSTELHRTHFITMLNRYAQVKGHTIIVVFDGGPTYSLTKEVYGSITVIFVGTQESADDYIIRILPEYKNKEVLLVTSDRHIIKNASRLSITTLDSDHFYDFLKEDNQHQPKKSLERVIKTSSINDEQRDAFMHKASALKIYKPDTFGQPPGKGSSYTLSKAQRKIVKKIKKL